MFVPDTAKTRVLAVAMAVTTAIPLFPRTAEATIEKPKAVAVEPAVKSVKKKQKRKGNTFHAPNLRAWGPNPMRHVITTRERIAAVLAMARAQIGKPYHWGAIGPSSFDCSGFTRYAWMAAGLELPHSSYAQRGATKSVSQADARPGDLVFFPGHVGLYVGDGKMIHAPHTGTTVTEAPIQSNLVGFGRPLS